MNQYKEFNKIILNCITKKLALEEKRFFSIMKEYIWIKGIKSHKYKLDERYERFSKKKVCSV